MIGGIVVGFGGYLLYNTVNKAGANSSREVREPLLAEAMAARRRDRLTSEMRFTVTVSTVLTRAYGSLTARHLIYGPLLACQVTI